MRTSSPTLSERIVCSEIGTFSSIILIEPGLDFAGVVEDSALAAIRPAHVADAHEERRGQAIGRANFHAEQSRFAAETHRANAEFIRGVQNVLLKLVEFGIRIPIIETAQELLLRKFVADRAIAADANAEDAGA